MTLCLAWFCLNGCAFDEAGLSGQPPDASIVRPDGARPDALVDGTSPDPDASLPDASVDGTVPCTNGELECASDGRARRCEGEVWVSLGRCAMGCDATPFACYRSSNVDADDLSYEESDLDDLELAPDTVVYIDTGTGGIQDLTNGVTLRAPVQGDVESGVGFYLRDQGANDPTLGVFVLSGLTVPAGTQVRVTGPNALVMLATSDVQIDGIIDAGASGGRGGPGGHDGGSGDQPGQGSCGGGAGAGVAGCPRLCSSGSGGGGFGGSGGNGGSLYCDAILAGDYISRSGGAGGGVCGTEELIPLVGGSGGGGGASVPAHTGGSRGPGGGGGGAIQISARGSITIGAGGGILNPGGGGAMTISGGGAGGGAGGGILLEASSFSVMASSFLAANGGGGGGGD